MKKFLFKAILFFILVFLMDMGFHLVVKRFDWNYSKAVAIAEFENQNYELVILGSSLGLDGLDANLMTQNYRPTYNFAFGGTRLRGNYSTIKYYLKSNIAPKQLIVALGACLSPSELSDTRPNLNPIINEVFTDQNKFGFDEMALVKFRWLGVELLKKIVSPEHRSAILDYGQLKISRSVLDKTNYQENIPDSLDKRKYENSVDLNSLISLCKKYDIELILIEMPGYKRTRNNIKVGPHYLNYAEYDEIVPLYNLNNLEFCKQVFNDKQDWLGNSHLNMYGAVKLTDYIVNNILNGNPSDKN